MVTLKIENIPDGLHKSLKIRAAKEGKSLRGLVLEILKGEVNEGIQGKN